MTWDDRAVGGSDLQRVPLERAAYVHFFWNGLFLAGEGGVAEGENNKVWLHRPRKKPEK